jgi:hypothetical protein
MIDSQVAPGINPRKRKVLWLIFALIALGTFLAWPTTSAQSPFWEVWVVNEAGQPLQGVVVTLSYQNYSAESEDHTERVQTDARGYAVFAPRSLRASRLRRIITTALSATAGVHASFGPHAWVWADGNGLHGYALSNGNLTDWTGKPPKMESRIVAKPR